MQPRPRTRRRSLVLVCLVAVVTSGCRQQEASSPEPLRELAVEATVRPAPDAPSGDAADGTEDSALAGASDDSAAGGSGSVPGDTTGAGTGSGGAASTPDPAQDRPGAGGSQGAARRALLGVDDRARDHGVEGPVWSDLARIELSEVGADLELRIRMRAPVPAAVADGTVFLASVDVLRGDDPDADVQLFVIGNGDGWFAHLYRDGGFVQYPGSFSINGDTLTLLVPWTSVGSPLRGTVSGLVEWSQERVVLGVAANAVAEDRLDGQPHAFDRSR